MGNKFKWRSALKRQCEYSRKKVPLLPDNAGGGVRTKESTISGGTESTQVGLKPDRVIGESL